MATRRQLGPVEDLTFVILRSERRLPLELPLLLLAQQLLLEVCHRLQEVFAGHVRGRNDDAAVQEFVDAVQEVLSVVGKIGNIVETLRGNTIRWHHLNAGQRPFPPDN